MTASIQNRLDLAQDRLNSLMNDDEGGRSERFDNLDHAAQEIVDANPDLVVLYRPSEIIGAFEFHVVTLTEYHENQYLSEAVYMAD